MKYRCFIQLSYISLDVSSTHLHRSYLFKSTYCVIIEATFSYAHLISYTFFHLQCLEEFEQTFPGTVNNIRALARHKSQPGDSSLDSLPILTQNQDERVQQAMTRHQRRMQTQGGGGAGATGSGVDIGVTEEELHKTHQKVD